MLHLAWLHIIGIISIIRKVNVSVQFVIRIRLIRQQERAEMTRSHYGGVGRVCHVPLSAACRTELLYATCNKPICLSLLLLISYHTSFVEASCTTINKCMKELCSYVLRWARLSAFAELRKETISFVMSVRLSSWNISVPTERVFMKLYI
jgi:hypothetical protein